MSGLVFHLIPHTHWDREWYLTRASFLARLVPVMDDLLDRLEADPAFRTFLLDGQTVLLEDYLRVRPDRRERLAALVGAGRLQVGPWYVLADELIASGESLVRNLLAGAADAERLGGRAGVLYSPDAFGHPAILPSLAAEFGITRGVVWRGIGGEAGQDRDLFRWRAPDGREMLVYHLPPDGYEVGATIPTGWSSIRASLVRRAGSPHIAVFVGADHHAAHPSLGKAREAIAGLEPGATVEVSRLDEFLALAGSTAEHLSRVEGELRWSYGYTWTLQGVHGTRAALKRRASAAELALERIAEPLAALALARGLPDSRPLLGEAWRVLLRSQFHDSIAGTTADPVARRVEARVEDAAAIAAEVARGSFEALVGHDPDRARDLPEQAAPALVLWNPAARRRGGVAVADLTWFRRDVLIGPPGGRRPRQAAGPSLSDIRAAVGGLPFQLLGRATGHERLDAFRHYPDQDEVEITRVAVLAPAADGLGFLPVGGGAMPRREEPPPVRVAGTSMENGLVRVEVARDGSVGLTDLRGGARHRRLLIPESERDGGDAYSFAGLPADRPRRPSGRAAVVPIATGPLVGALVVASRVAAGGGQVDLRLTLSLHAGSGALRCTVEVHNRARDHRLRLRLSGAARHGAVVAGGPFGPVIRHPVRTQRGRDLREAPVPTAPAHRFVAGGGPPAGLALLAPGFFEYQHTDTGDLIFTVLRAIGSLSRDDLPTRPGHAAWPVPIPRAQSLGVERFQIALLPTDGGRAGDPAALARAWEDLFLPVRPVWLRQAGQLSPPSGGLVLEGDGLVLSAVKPGETGAGIVLRCYNPGQGPVGGRWRLPFPASAAFRVRADEREPRPVTPEDAGHTVPFGAGPREIVTLLVLP